jgi:hypothetical protein
MSVITPLSAMTPINMEKSMRRMSDELLASLIFSRLKRSR